MKALVGWVLLAAACGGCGAPEAGGGFSVADSSGVRIVTSEAPAWGAGDGWRVEPVPAVDIGVAEGEEAYLLYRVSSARRLADGRIAVGNSGTHHVRLYDATGRFESALGRQGGGPGEFGEFSSLRICERSDGDIGLSGDRPTTVGFPARGGLLVVDGANDRVNAYDPDGTVAGTVKPEALPNTRPPNVLGCFDDGSFLTWTPAGTGTLQGADGEIIRSESHFHRHLPDGSYGTRLAAIATQPRVVNELNGVTNFPFVPLSAAPAYVAGRSRLYIGAGEVGSVAVRGLDGTLLSRIEWPARGRHATAAVWDRYTQASLEDLPDNRRPQYARLYERDLPLPDSTPAYRALLEDETGHLWVERYRLPWEEARMWEVFDPDGRWLGTVEMPSGLTVFQIGADFVLGRHLDDLGIERVRLHALSR